MQLNSMEYLIVNGRFWLSCLGLCIWLGWINITAQACLTPVFRYAFERWELNPYELVVFHDLDGSAEEQTWIQALQSASLEGQGQGNFFVERVALNESMSPEWADLWQTQQKAVLPWLLLRYPFSRPQDPYAWAGPLTKSNVTLLTQAKCNVQLAEHLASGNCIPWLVVLSGQSKKDEACCTFLESQLRQQERTISIPVDPFNPDRLAEVRLQFPVLRISQAQPDQAILAGLILNSHEALAKLDEPVVVPVFGRGRALCAMPASEVDEWTIQGITEFFINACSCEVKEQNPGLDLMLAADWSAITARLEPESAPELMLVGLSDISEAEPRSASAPPIEVSQSVDLPSNGRLKRNLLGVGGGVVGLVVILTWVLVRAQVKGG